MNFSARFSEFGMTGAVFWICQILLFTIGTGEAAGEQFLNLFGDFMGTEDTSSPLLKTAAGSLLTIFGLIGIFVTGLILDMIGSIFFMQEMRIFGGHVSRNIDWLDGMTEKCSTSIAEDYRNFQKEFDNKNTSKKHMYTRQLNPRFHYRRFMLRFHYKHLKSFLFSYIHAYSANGTISTALFIVAIEVIIFENVEFCENVTFCKNVIHAADEIPHDSGPTTLIIYGTLLALSAMLTLKSYNRMCFSLFTLSCATNSHQLLSKYNPETDK